LDPTGGWAVRASVLVVAGALAAGCSLGAGPASALKHPGGTGPPAGSPGAAAGGAPAAAPTGPAQPDPAQPAASAPAPGAAGATSPYLPAAGQQALTQDQAAVDQDLAQITTELATSDQASSGGENDVPSN
jgi:pilus assembly protein FimV